MDFFYDKGIEYNLEMSHLGTNVNLDPITVLQICLKCTNAKRFASLKLQIYGPCLFLGVLIELVVNVIHVHV